MKNVVITGSTRGIGLAMAKEFLKAGCNVTISGRAAEPSPVLLKELAPYGGQYHYVMCNVQHNEELEKLWQAAAARWQTIDIWINNAGQNSPHEYCCETAASAVDAIIDTNIKGMIYGSQLAAKMMQVQGKGQIWNMEGLGSDDMIQAKTILYGTTKRALTYFTKALAKELQGTNVQAGRLSPGMMLTDFITKNPDGSEAAVIKEKNFKFIFNLLGDKPETVAAFFIPRILKNTKNDAHLMWLTKPKIAWRFLTSPIVKRKLI